MKLEDIKKAVEQGQTVHWKNKGYTVQKWKNGDFYVVFSANKNAVGLEYEGQLQGQEGDFFLEQSN